MQNFIVGNHCPNIFRKILELKGIIILESTNEYCKILIPKSDHKMDLYLARKMIGNWQRFYKKSTKKKSSI